MSEKLDEKGRRVISRGGEGHGGGYLACDGKNHFWVVPDYKPLQCLPETPVGPCPAEGNCIPEMRITGVKGEPIGTE